MRTWLEESACGQVTVDDAGASYFTEKENGLHKILRFNPKREEAELIAELGDYIDDCAMEVCKG
jgi:hypothetical protein